MPKATAIAHTIQGLIKYHGLKDKKRRIPFHNSISVCAEALTTTATIEFGDYSQDSIEINGKHAVGTEAERVQAVVAGAMSLAKSKGHYRLKSANNLKEGKGLGFSAAAFASIAHASTAALGLKMEPEKLSEIARLGAGSAARSLVGGFAIWYANRNGRSYAKQLASGSDLKFAMALVPIPSPVKTETAHEESVSSPLFKARVKQVEANLPRMLKAIQKRDTDEVAKLAEADSLSLHAITMTGRSGMVLMSPETIRIIERVRAMREKDHIPVWYSMDTGPSVFVNTHPEFVDQVSKDIHTATGLEVITSGVGGPARKLEEHLF